MTKFSNLFSEETNLRTLIPYILAATVLIVIAFIIGISDNLPGIILIYIGIFILVYGLTHQWKESKKFRKLLIASIIGFFVFTILHNLFYGISKEFEDVSIVRNLSNWLGAASFIISVLICPVTIVIGLWGWIKNKHK